jgi:hypothetical protein
MYDWTGLWNKNKTQLLWQLVWRGVAGFLVDDLRTMEDRVAASCCSL